MEKRFTDIFIKRPVFATCISLIILLTGIVSFTHMSVRLFPKIDASTISITVAYPGAPSDVMEGFVATPIEEAVSQVDGIDYITSSSSQGVSNITVNMKLGYNINTAMTDISSQVNSIRGNLPINIDPPIVSKRDPNAQPIMWIAFTTTSMSDKQLTDYLLRVVQPQLQLINGVSQAEIIGGRQYAMRIWLNPYLMAARKVTASDVYSAIKQQNVIAPAGVLKSKMQQFDLYASTDLKTANQFNDLVIRNDHGHMVRIKDIGQAVLGAQDMDYSVVVNGKTGIFMAVEPKPNANVLDVAKGVHKLLPSIHSHLPAGVSFKVIFDSTTFITSSIHEVIQTILEAAFLVFLVIFLMIGSFRAVLIPLVTIPLSLAGATIFMLAFHFSINTLTLLAFVLAIGLVVDDSIVVLENIHRHLEAGMAPFQAALTGAREISFAVIAMTLTLAAVFAPIGFLGGLTGQLFTEFAFTLAGAVIFSGFIALTLSPMMCSKVYRQGDNIHAGLAGVADNIFAKLRAGYKKSLGWMIKFRYIVIIVALLIYGLCYLLYVSVPQELAPTEDQGAFYSIVQSPTGSNLDYTTTQSNKLINIYKKYVPEMKDYFIVNGFPMGINSALSVVSLKDWSKRKRTAQQIQQSLFGPMWSIPGAEVFPALPSALPGAGGFTPIEFILSTTGSYASLEKQSNKFIEELRHWGGLANPRSDLHIDNPQINININRNAAADLGIKMSAISMDLNTFLSKPKVNYFNINGRSYEVLPRLYRKYRNIPTALNNLQVRTESGALVPLSSIVKLTTTVVPESRNHFQQLRSATIKANLAPGVSLGTALVYMTQLANKTLGKGIHIDYSHESRQYIETAGAMGTLMLFALIFIYLILAAQFESFRDPLVIMLSVPLAITGALVGLHLLGGSLNIYTKIGLLTLVGLITKNGILIVEFANQQQRNGVEFKEAILAGASERLRPILMTTCAIVLGALPLVLASGAGAASRMQMGIVVTFGMAIGTLFTLFILPTAYYLLASKKHQDTP